MPKNNRSRAAKKGWETRRRREQEERSMLQNPSGDLLDAFTSPTTFSGRVVNNSTAMRFSVVHACIKVISEDIASLPFVIYKRTGDGKNRFPTHPLFSLLHDSPNSEQSAIEFWNFLLVQVLLTGNAFAIIERNNAGTIVGLQPIPTSELQITRTRDGQIQFVHYPSKQAFLDADIFRFHNLSTGGLLGDSPISLSRQAIGIGLAQEEFAARFYNNGAKLSGVITSKRPLANNQRERFSEQFKQFTQSSTNAHKTVVLPYDMDFQPLSVPPKDAEFIASRNFSTEDIARIYRVPLHLLQNLDRATFSNIEQQSLDYLTHTLRPWIKRIEQAVKRDLMLPVERSFLVGEFLTADLLSTDTATRITALTTQLEHGLLTINEARAIENRNPVNGGDVLLVSQQVQTLKNVLNPPAAFRSAEKREAPSLPKRVEYTDSQKPVFETLAAALIAEESKTVRGFITDTISKADLTDLINQFYDTREPKVLEKMQSVLGDYASTLTDLTAQELNSADTPDIAEFQDQVIQGSAHNWTESSRNQLTDVISAEETDYTNALDNRLQDWHQTRAKKFSGRESQKIGGAVFRAASIAIAATTTFVWRTRAGECPMCQHLDGKTVGKHSSFVNQGETIPGSTENRSASNFDIRHPPLHKGCVCYIEAR